MAFALTDALAAHRAALDSSHKFWGYYQAVSLGAAGFAWSQQRAELHLFAWLSVGFILFAVLSWRVVVDAQDQAFTAATCIKQYVRSPLSAVPNEWKQILLKLDTDSPKKGRDRARRLFFGDPRRNLVALSHAAAMSSNIRDKEYACPTRKS